MIAKLFPLLAALWISLDGTCGSGSDASSTVATAVRWLKSQRGIDYGWGQDTARVVTALAMLGELNRTEIRANNDKASTQVENGSGFSDCSNDGENLISKQLEVELMLELWKPRNEEQNPGRLALFILAFTALCKDIRNFHGHDILSQLLRHEPEAPYELGLTVLATCAGEGYPKRRMLRKIAEIVNDPPQLHLVDVFSVSTMALICVLRNGQSEQTSPQVPIQLPSQTGLQRAVATLLKTMLQKIAESQEEDGSFGNEFSTALGIQALTNPDFPVDGWDKAKAYDWLSGRIRPDGSFGTVGETSQILLALASPGGLSKIDHRKCKSGPTQAIQIPLTPTPNATPKDNDRKGVQVTYTLWINRNVTDIKEMTLRVPENTTFFEVMKAAAEMDSDYEFSATIWPNGHYVHTIGGRQEQPIGFHFWLLYRLPFIPDPKNPPPTDFVAPSGVDDIFVQDGDRFLFWFKNI